MNHPTQEELRELKTLINTHAVLLDQHLQREAACLFEVERGPELVAAEITMAEALLAHDYQPREGPDNSTGYITFPTVYCVHAYYLHAFDNGRYDSDMGTWSIELGDVPEWALLQIYPLIEDKEAGDTQYAVDSRVKAAPQPVPSTRLVVSMWLKDIIDRFTKVHPR